ncbi:MAG: hypothetical protein MK106_04670, partial [Mariniblastus sp.]|nr:hypothetical protein [Mariniblastus sp.]
MEDRLIPTADSPEATNMAAITKNATDRPYDWTVSSAIRGPIDAIAQAPPNIKPDAKLVWEGIIRCPRLIVTGVIAANPTPAKKHNKDPSNPGSIKPRRAIAGAKIIGT